MDDFDALLDLEERFLADGYAKGTPTRHRC